MLTWLLLICFLDCPYGNPGIPTFGKHRLVWSYEAFGNILQQTLHPKKKKRKEKKKQVSDIYELQFYKKQTTVKNNIYIQSVVSFITKNSSNLSM